MYRTRYDCVTIDVLQIAARRPKCLATVISLYSTDDRYADDVHYIGGCVLAEQMLSWATVMFAWNARPPTMGSDVSQWLSRLRDDSEPWVHKWLAHQSRDDYWRSGSICEDYAAVACPVFLIGGWADAVRHCLV